MKSRQIALVVKARRHFGHRNRTKEVVHHVFFATPDHLDRNIWVQLGDRNGLMHKILYAASTAKATTQVHRLDIAIGQRQTRRFRERCDRGFGVLRGHPGVGTVATHLHHAVHRFHCDVGQKLAAIHRFDFFG